MNPLVNRSQTAQTTTSMPTQTARPNPMQFMSQFMQNPIGALRSAGFNVPNGMNDPRQIVNHLINNGQLGGARLNQLRGLAQMIGKSEFWRMPLRGHRMPYNERKLGVL